MAGAKVRIASGLEGDALRLQDYIVRKKKPNSLLGLTVIREVLGTRDNARLFAAVSPLVEARVMEPTKSARRGGSATMPLYEKYRIAGESPEHDLTELHPLLVSTNHLETHPEVCDRWWDELRALSKWLQNPHGGAATLRERCWEVFGNEKAADEKGWTSCVRNATGRDLRELLSAMEDEPEDLSLFVREGVLNPRHVVVSENRDPYLAIRRCLLRGATTIFDHPIDAVVWGQGNCVRQGGGRSLMRALETMHASHKARVLYWGDIDREGLRILKDLFDAGLVEPLEDAYALMFEVTNRDPRESPDGRGLVVPDISSAFVSPTLTERIADTVFEGGLLPQEVLSASLIEEAMA